MTASLARDGYWIQIASDVSKRNGLGAELYDATDRFLAEIFREDSTEPPTVTFQAFTEDPVPFDVLLWFVEAGKTL